MQSFIFGANQEAKTPEELAKRRAVQDSLAKAILGRAPQNVGEGLSQMGQALAYRIMANKNNAAEKAGRESADQAFGGIDFSSLFGGGAAYPSAVADGASPTSGAATGTAAPFAGNVQSAIAEAATRHGVDPEAMSVIAQIESNGNPNAKNPSSSAGGLFQFIDSTAKQYGLENKFDPMQAADAGARLMKDNAAYLGKVLGRSPNTGELYLAHQQGAGGAAKLLSNPNARAADIVGADAVRLNGGNPNMTAGDFANIWMSKASKLAGNKQPQGVQVASLDPSIGLGQQGGATIRAGDYGPSSSAGNAPADGARATFGGPQLTYDDKGLRFVDEGAQRVSVQSAPAIAPYDFTGNPQLSAGAGMPFQGGQPQPQQMASVQPQQQTDPKAAIRDALLRQNDMMLGGALAPQGQAPQQIADASGAFPPAPTGQPFAGQQGGDARGAMVQKLMQAAQNPWLNDNQRAMVNALLQKQMEQGDPMRQLQMQKLQQDIARGGQTSDWSKLDDNRLFNQRTGEIRDLPTNPNAPSGDLGLNPQYGLDKDGNPVLLQLGKNGKVVQSQMPDGVTLSKEPIKLDAGTHFVLLDPITRQPVGQIPKDVAGAASEGASGKAQGEASANLPVVEANANAILGMIDSLDTDPYLDSMVGPVSSRLPNVSAEAARVQSKMDQIGGQAFLQAFNSLKGGGQITEIEGQKATQAIARLNAAQSPADYRQALNELRQIVSTGVQRARQQAGGGAAGQAAPAPQSQAPAPANNGGFRIIGVE
ncbi:transglycosylase SLT domain-containing protein [Brucella intermedia]|uniref:transglycosylase SLT domain-containing protein n=1 Tax=Brucella intermedia TaxID=94625 RepID=UPI00124C1FA6|nr:transglycosylase SLT domain-containing protein [Brucella intermedia]KAB2725418.1 transglycosylase SLT domain-containing protein [Brucella intermedia]